RAFYFHNNMLFLKPSWKDSYMLRIFRKRLIPYSGTFIIPAVFILSVAGTMNMGCDDSGSRSDKGMDGLQDHVVQLEALADRAEAIRAVKRLQYAHGHYAEFGLWDDLADLFAEGCLSNFRRAQ
ncbi:MAG: nuclear transport factor 2 family protein, partial [Acidobacteria bacterium]|nr:nuclear transport factor 2 family protein [Acidobacteriota bacterium]